MFTGTLAGWVAYWAATSALVLVFAAAAWHKVRSRQRFAASLAAYEILPESASTLAAFVLVAAEVLVVASLLSPVGPGALPALVLLSVYTLAIVINLARGHSEIDCGCGDLPTPISGWLVARNLFLMAMTTFLWSRESVEAVGRNSLWAWLLMILLVVLLVIFYMTLNQLLANRPYRETGYG